MSDVRSLADLISAMGEPGPDALRLRKGTVVSVQSASSVTVTVGGSTVQVSGVLALEPVAAGDVVFLFQQGPLLMVAGKPSTADVAWHTVGAAGEIQYLNGHSSYDYGGTVAYYRNASGMVSIQGIVTKAANTSAMFVMPVGYRPRVHLIWNSQTAIGAMEMRLESGGALFSTDGRAAAWASVAVSYQAGA